MPWVEFTITKPVSLAILVLLTIGGSSRMTLDHDKRVEFKAKMPEAPNLRNILTPGVLNATER